MPSDLECGLIAFCVVSKLIFIAKRSRERNRKSRKTLDEKIIAKESDNLFVPNMHALCGYGLAIIYGSIATIAAWKKKCEYALRV